MLKFIHNWLVKRARSCKKCGACASCPGGDLPAFAFMYKNEVARKRRKIARNCIAYHPEIPEFLK